jgi:hypothetical protein
VVDERAEPEVEQAVGAGQRVAAVHAGARARGRGDPARVSFPPAVKLPPRNKFSARNKLPPIVKFPAVAKWPARFNAP